MGYTFCVALVLTAAALLLPRGGCRPAMEDEQRYLGFAG
jgi:hypothetical protein